MHPYNYMCHTLHVDIQSVVTWFKLILNWNLLSLVKERILMESSSKTSWTSPYYNVKSLFFISYQSPFILYPLALVFFSINLLLSSFKMSLVLNFFSTSIICQTLRGCASEMKKEEFGRYEGSLKGHSVSIWSASYSLEKNSGSDSFLIRIFPVLV